MLYMFLINYFNMLLVFLSLLFQIIFKTLKVFIFLLLY